MESYYHKIKQHNLMHEAGCFDGNKARRLQINQHALAN